MCIRRDNKSWSSVPTSATWSFWNTPESWTMWGHSVSLWVVHPEYSHVSLTLNPSASWELKVLKLENFSLSSVVALTSRDMGAHGVIYLHSLQMCRRNVCENTHKTITWYIFDCLNFNWHSGTCTKSCAKEPHCSWFYLCCLLCKHFLSFFFPIINYESTEVSGTVICDWVAVTSEAEAKLHFTRICWRQVCESSV